VSRRLTPGWRIRATLTALVLPPLVHVVSMERISRWMARRGVPSPDPTVDDESLAEWVDRVLQRMPPPWRKTCLKRAIVIQSLLRRAGRPAELRIGVRRDEAGNLAAHAWLARDGLLYLEPAGDPVGSYQVLAAFPSRSEGSS
jgi:hypothetical protein